MSLAAVASRITRLENKHHTRLNQVKLIGDSKDSWTVVNDLMEFKTPAAALQHIQAKYLTKVVMVDESRYKMELLTDDDLAKIIYLCGKPEDKAANEDDVNVTKEDEKRLMKIINEPSKMMAAAEKKYPGLKFKQFILTVEQRDELIKKLFQKEHLTR